MWKRDSNGSSESERLLLEHGRTLQETSGLYTGDGSVGINGNPVLKQNTGNWKACSFILGSECCERLAYYGIATNLVTYLTRKLHQGNVSAAKNVAIWQGTCYLTPLVGAVLADASLGRYWTIALSTMIYFLGLVALTLTATVPGLRPSECTNSECPTSTIAQSAVFLSGLYMIALGTGGIKPCVSPFGADQFDTTDPKESVKKASFFHWYYFTICVGIILSSIFLVWIQDNIGWGLGFGIPALFMAMATAVFLSGTPFYRIQKPRGSPFTRICQVLVASYCKRNLEVPEDKSLLYETQDKSCATELSCRLEHIDTLKFLDKAAVKSEAEISSGELSNRWSLCTATQVEELKSLLRLFPIWATGILFYVVLGQAPIYVEQGMTMDTMIAGPLSISAATFSTIDAVFVMLLIPIYDRLIVPALKRITGNEKGVSILQRIGAGLFFSVLCLVSSAVLETSRLRTTRDGHARLSIFWQTPQYFLMSVSEMLAYVGQMELLYEEAPVVMRSFCSALVFLSLSIGFYLSSFLLTFVTYFTAAEGGGGGWIPDDLNEGHLDYYFWLLAGLCFLNLFAFVVCAKNFKQSKDF